MAFKIPFLSKKKKDEIAELTDAGDSGVAALGGGPATLLAQEPSAANAQAAAMQAPSGASEVERNLNATFIGDALQKTGDIRLPLIGHLPLQYQVRSLLIMILRLALSCDVVMKQSH